MTKESVTHTPDPLELLPLGGAEAHGIRVREAWRNIKRARKIEVMPEGEDREEALRRLRVSLQGGESVKSASGGPGTGERHTRQSNLGSETIL